MKIIIEGAGPIEPGYDHDLFIGFDPLLFDVLYRAPRLVAQFRATIGGPLLATLDSADGAIGREEPNTLQIKLPVAATTAFAALNQVVFDFVGFGETGPEPIPGLFIWPVQIRVTNDVQ